MPGMTSVEPVRSDLGGEPGRDSSKSCWYTRELCARRRKVNWKSGCGTRDMGVGGWFKTHSARLVRKPDDDVVDAYGSQRVGGKRGDPWIMA